MQLGQYPTPTHVIAHLSDPHLLAGGALQYGVIDTEAGLARALERLRHVDPAPQVLIFTGDLADKAEPAAYARLRELVEPAAAAMGAQVVWTMGNHDERADVLPRSVRHGADEPQDRVYDVDGLRVVALDTSVPGYHHGELTDDQLAWLAGVLATPAGHGTVLALHHPPIPVPMLRAAELIELADQDRLAAVVEGTRRARDHRRALPLLDVLDVRRSARVRVVGQLLHRRPRACRSLRLGRRRPQAFTMMHVYADRIVHTIVPLAEAPEVSGHPADVVAQVEALSPRTAASSCPVRTRTSTLRRDESRPRTVVRSPGRLPVVAAQLVMTT